MVNRGIADNNAKRNFLNILLPESVNCFGSKSFILVKDVDGLYDADPNQDPGASFIKEIGSKELKKMNLSTLPFDRIVLDLLDNTRLLKQIQIVNGLKPDNIEAAMRGEHVGTIIHAS